MIKPKIPKCPCRIMHLLKTLKSISKCVCFIHEQWMSIRVFLSGWIYRYGYYHGHCMDTSTRGMTREKCFRFSKKSQLTYGSFEVKMSARRLRTVPEQIATRNWKRRLDRGLSERRPLSLHSPCSTLHGLIREFNRCSILNVVMISNDTIPRSSGVLCLALLSIRSAFA